MKLNRREDFYFRLGWLFDILSWSTMLSKFVLVSFASLKISPRSLEFSFLFTWVFYFLATLALNLKQLDDRVASEVLDGEA